MAAAKLKRNLGEGRRARVLVVDDSSVMRRLVTLALENDPCLEVVGFAKDGREALEKFAKLMPDAVTMDIEMPEMDGLEALRHIHQLAPQVRVVMLSAFTERGAAATLEALALGAADYVTKQAAGQSIDDSTSKLRAELAPKLKQFFAFSGPVAAIGVESDDLCGSVAPAHSVESMRTKAPPIWHRAEYVPRVVVIGISTGGPTALARILPDIPKDFPLPVLIVQHMPASFTKTLCERLQEHLQLDIHEAQEGEVVRPGVVLVAPGDYHMRVGFHRGERQPRILLDQEAPENFCRPAVNVLFESVANVYGGAVVAAVLTGMGQDGLRGVRLLKRAGATILAQDAETSAVWGMPRAIVQADLADVVLPLDEIMPQILRYCQPSAGRHEANLREAPECQK